MFRTLLRTLPSLSGNVKFNINLEKDYTINNKTILTKVNKAFLTTAGQDKNSFVYNINLLSSNWDYDLSKFYSFYSNRFYKSSFSFIKNDINILDKYNEVKERDLDYEFGASRLDYNVYNNQYSFFAPIYIDNIFDLPNQFEITLSYELNGREVSKQIIVPLRPENYNGLYENDNILYNYLYRYLKRVDSKIINISGSQIKFYGVDLLRGGFNEYSQPGLAVQIFKSLNPFQKTDSLISSGFKVSNMCVKQILPLTFNFNINDLFSKTEAARLAFVKVKVSGAYKYTDDINQSLKNISLPLYDFDINVDELYLNKQAVNPNTLNPYMYLDKTTNLLDQDFPGLHDSKFYKYQFSNRISPNYTRWRIQKTNSENKSIFDNENYLINFSSVFNSDNNNYFNTINTNSKIQSVSGICNIVKYDKSNIVITPFDSNYDTISSTLNNQSIDLSNLILPYNKLYYSYTSQGRATDENKQSVSFNYRYNDYYKVINSYLDYNNYINNRNTFIYDHFNTIYLSSEYLESPISHSSSTRKIDVLSQYSYINDFNLSYIIDDSYKYSLYSDINNTASIFDKANVDYTTLWHTPVNDAVFYNGILYDLSNIYNTNSYNKYINTLNDEKYDKIAYTNHLIDYLNDKNYNNWLKTQKITKFGVFYLPIPNIILNDSYLNTARIALSYTYKDATNTVNYQQILNGLSKYTTSTTYIQLYDTTNSYNNTVVSYNESLLRTSQTLEDINLSYGDKDLYINASDLSRTVIDPIANDNNYFIDNEYILIDSIFTNIVPSIKESHRVALEKADFLDKIRLPFEVSMGIHGLNGVYSKITLKKIYDFLIENENYQASFKKITGLDSLKDLNEKIFNCIYDLLIYYYTKINSSNIPVCLIDNDDIITIFEDVFYKHITSKLDNATIFINKFNIKNIINNAIIDKENVNYPLNNLYIKQFDDDTLIPITYNNFLNSFNYERLKLNNAIFVFKGSMVLKSEFESACNKATFSFDSAQTNSNIINALSTRYVLNNDIIKYIKKIYNWLVDDNCKILNQIIGDNTYLWINKSTYYNNIDAYIADSVSPLSKMVFIDSEGKKVFGDFTDCLGYINYLYVDAFSNINESSRTTSFLLLSDAIKSQINGKSIYKYTPILLTTSGKEIAKNIFVPFNTEFYGEENLLWVNTFNVNNIRNGFYKEGFVESYSKTLYSLFISLDHLKNYMQYIVADEDGLYKLNTGHSEGIPYYQWINLDMSSIKGGPFENLYVVENKIVYNNAKQTYENLNRYIPIKDYLRAVIADHIRANNVVNDGLDNALLSISDKTERESIRTSLIEEAIIDVLKFYSGYTLFDFVNNLQYNPDNYSFSFKKYLGTSQTVEIPLTHELVQVNVDLADESGQEIPFRTSFLLAQKSEYLPVTSEILVDEWKLFDSNGNVINYTYNNDDNIDFYFYYLYPREELDSNLTDTGNKANFILYDSDDYNKYENAVWSQTGVLKPLFNTYRTEKLIATKLYSETILNNIKSFIYKDNYLFPYGNIMFKYVFNTTIDTVVQLNKNMCEIISGYLETCDESTKKTILGLNVYKSIDLSNIIVDCTPHDGNKYDELDLFNTNKLYTYYKDGENYGFYIHFIRATQTIVNDLYKFSNRLNYNEQTKTLTGNHISENSFLAIDNVPLVEFHNNNIQLSVKGAQYMCSKLIDLLYFNQNIIFSLINNINTLKLPNNYIINNDLQAVKINYSNLLNNTNEYNIIANDNNYETNLIRYAKYIEPNFKKVYNNIDYVYNLKFKTINDKLLKYHIYNSIGDSPIYKSSVNDDLKIFGISAPDESMFDSVDDYNTALKEYQSNIYYNNIIERFTPYELKSFNTNQYYVLPEKISFSLGKKCTYAELINYDKTEVRLSRFIQYCEDVYGLTNRSEILFLYNRYTSRLEFVADGLDEYNNNKVYSGKFIFTLN